METTKKAAQKLTVARSQLILSHGFFGMLALRLKLVEKPAIPTLAVDGNHIFYNSSFIVDKLSDSLCRSAVAHEVMHCALNHLSRVDDRNPKKWNYACDYAINQILKDSGFEVGEHWLISPVYKDMTADQIYAALPDDFDKDEGATNGQGPLDEMMSNPSADAIAEAADWKIATVQAATMAKAQGKLPGSLERFVDSLTTPQVDWREQLRRFVTEVTKDDYSWGRPNRRFLAAGHYMPSLYSEGMGELVVGIDTSGSIDDKTLQAFGAEVRAIAASVRPTKIHVVYCDAEVNHVDEFFANDELSFKAHGGGGTAFKPVFTYVAENAIMPACLVYLTDLYGHHTFPSPDYPTLWVCTSEVQASFGTTIKIGV